MKHITHKARYLWNHVLYPTGAKAGFHYIVLAGQFTRRASNSQYSCLLLSRLPGAGNQVLKQNLRKRTFPLDLLHFGTGCLNWQQLVLLKSPSPFADFPRISTFPPEITWTFFFFFKAGSPAVQDDPEFRILRPPPRYWDWRFSTTSTNWATSPAWNF